MSQVNTCLNQMIQKSSNQPTQIINQLPRIISDRLSKNYSNGKIYKSNVQCIQNIVEDTLKHGGYRNTVYARR